MQGRARPIAPRLSRNHSASSLSRCCSSTSQRKVRRRLTPPSPPVSSPRRLLLPPPPLPPPPQVQLSGGPREASATTDDQGYFELDVPEAPSLSALSGSLLRLDRGGGDGEGGGGGGCVDTAVGLPPPISLGALVPIFEKGGLEESGGGGEHWAKLERRRGRDETEGSFLVLPFTLTPKKLLKKTAKISFSPGSKEAPFTAINGITTLAYYTKKNVATPQVSP